MLAHVLVLGNMISMVAMHVQFYGELQAPFFKNVQSILQTILRHLINGTFQQLVFHCTNIAWKFVNKRWHVHNTSLKSTFDNFEYHRSTISLGDVIALNFLIKKICNGIGF